MDIREANNFGGIEEEVNHWWIRTRFNYINEIIKYYNSKNITSLLASVNAYRDSINSDIMLSAAVKSDLINEK
jgi:hypothetical protein